MSIRSASKAVIERDGYVLLQRCRTKYNGEFYELPGGGQRQYETMEQAVIRECLEETGYTVRVERFLALHEEIMTSPSLRRRFPNYTHRVFHIFLCRVTDARPATPTETDLRQIGLEWVPLPKISALTLRPAALRPVLADLLESGGMAYVKTEIIGEKKG